MVGVRNGTVKINTQTLSPVDLVSEYIKRGCKNVDEVLELQWADMLKKGIEGMPEGLENAKILPVCDVSGSMNGTPMNVSIGLGAYIAKVNKGVFKDLVISFSQDPEMIDISKNETLLGIIKKICWAENVGFSTNIQKTFGLILGVAKANKISRDQMPEKILIISDMEFDQAQVCDAGDVCVTNLDAIRCRFKEAGYVMPQIIFWNVRTTGTAPCRSGDDGVLYLGGYSKNIVTMLMNNEFPNPLSVLYGILDSSRYDVIKV
jgi:hypothetical protein